MNPVADNPVIVPQRELEEDKKPGESKPPASAARCAAGRPAKRTNGLVPAATNGTRSTPEVFAPRVFTSGLRPSASLAAGGRCIRIGMRSDLFNRGQGPR